MKDLASPNISNNGNQLTISNSGNPITFSLVNSKRARSMRITIFPTGKVQVTSPRLVPEFLVMKFVNNKAAWITKKLEYFSKHPISADRLLLNKLGRKDFKQNKEKALVLITKRMEHFNRYYHFEYKGISIRNQKSRWGSCSHMGNLSFNYKIIFLRPELQDYIVVHELCHLKEMNHSKDFWSLIKEQIPSYSELRRKLQGT